MRASCSLLRTLVAAFLLLSLGPGVARSALVTYEAAFVETTPGTGGPFVATVVLDDSLLVPNDFVEPSSLASFDLTIYGVELTAQDLFAGILLDVSGEPLGAGLVGLVLLRRGPARAAAGSRAPARHIVTSSTKVAR